MRPSAIRYYEQEKIIPAAPRVSGQRRYGLGAVYRLAVLRRAQEAGFTLDEVRQLFSGFRRAVPLSARWRRMAENKQIELDGQMRRIQSRKELLTELETGCLCESVEECGASIVTERIK